MTYNVEITSINVELEQNVTEVEILVSFETGQGEGDGTVESVTSTDNHIVVDNTDPANPSLSFQLVDNENYVTDDEKAALHGHDFVEETENKFLRDDNTFQPIETAVGGYANNLYLDPTPSDVPTYETLTYIPASTATEHEHTVKSSEGEKLIHTYLYPSAVVVDLIPSGLWSFNFWGRVSSAAGITQLGVTYFARHTDNSESDLFTLWSNEINNIVNDWIKFEITNPAFGILTTDRMGVRVKIKTTSVTDKTIYTTVGDGYGAFLNNPNKIRHSQLRALNEDVNFLHVTSIEKAAWTGKQEALTAFTQAVQLTAAQYAALTPKVSTTLYIIIG